MSRLDLTSKQRRRLQQQLSTTKDARVFRRTMAALQFAQGQSVIEIATMLGVTRQTVYHWLESYTVDSDPKALEDLDGRGRPRLLGEDEEHFLETLFSASPQDYGYSNSTWTLPLLQDALEGGTGAQVSKDALRRALRRLDYIWKRPRYVLQPDPDREKKTAYFAANSATSQT